MLLRELAITAALLFFASAALAEELPTPASLEPAVRFWTRVYTEVDSHSGLIHDAENLGVVYQTVHFPEDLNYRGRDQRTEQAKREIRAILLELANGKRDGLSGDEERVLAQWPANVSDATLSQAADNVRFQAGLCDRFRAGLVRSGMWRPFVERALAERGVPPQLVALPHVESSYNPKAYSRVGAAGMWQFMRSTGRLFLRMPHRLDAQRLGLATAKRAFDNVNKAVRDQEFRKLSPGLDAELMAAVAGQKPPFRQTSRRAEKIIIRPTAAPIESPVP